MHKYFFVFLFFLFSFYAIAQKETNNWFFGYNAGLNFNSGLPIPINGGSVHSIECSASVSDIYGNLLFYTDGEKVYDRNHNQMPGGFGLISNQSSTQGALIVQKPSSINLYYIFNVNAGCSTPFVYSIVDINANGGVGDVISKNNIIFSNSNYFEKLTAIKHCNNKDIWVIIMGRDTTSLGATDDGGITIPNESADVKLFCFLLTQFGISNYPITTNLGNLNTAICSGQLKASPNGRNIAFGNSKGYSFLNFNKKSGILDNLFTDNFSTETGYGLEFSPNNKLLYFNNYQVNILNKNKIMIGHPILSQYQLATDNKIYFINNDSGVNYFDNSLNYTFLKKKLSSIGNPNIIGLSCNVNYDNVNINNDTAIFGLPNFPAYHFYHPSGEFSYQNNCLGNSTNFSLINGSILDSVKWIFSDGTISNALNPSHTFINSGIYDVSVITYQNGISDTTAQCVTINGSFSNFLGSDKIICSDEYTMIGVSYPYIGNYSWNTGDTTAGIVTNVQGAYWLRITNECGVYYDTINIEKIFCEPEIFIPNVFTPNGDNTNDNYTITIKNIKTLSYTIYDRWGLKMKEGNFSDQSTSEQTLFLWDGKYNQRVCTDGVYFYIINYTNFDDKDFQAKGFITLLK